MPPGTFIFAPLTEYLVASYGWKNAMLILAAVLCSCSFFGVLFRPLEPVRTPKRQPKYVCMYSVFTNNVPLAVRFATISIGTRKAESPEYGRSDRDLQ